MAGPSINQPYSSRVAAKSPYVTDNTVKSFLHPDFDPADYLNSTLPPLSASSSRPTSNQARTLALPELSTALQTLLTQLNAQTTRLSNTLNQLTDEIIRSGSRLAYEVDVLSGEANTLTETLDTTLKPDISLFVPQPPPPPPPESADEPLPKPSDPTSLDQLQTLHQIRSRLTSVTRTFDAAMSWPAPPPDSSSSILSVSVSDPETLAREEKGKAFISTLQNDLNNPETRDEALGRVEELRGLLEVWKGTAEEKGRGRVLEGLPTREGSGGMGVERGSGRQGVVVGDMRYRDQRGDSGGQGGGEEGYGFLQNLRNLRNELYVD